jgi:hypothetical protein
LDLVGTALLLSPCHVSAHFFSLVLLCLQYLFSVFSSQDASASTLRTTSSFGAAHAMFASRVNKGESSSSTDGAASGGAGSTSWTKHQGCINGIQAMAKNAKGQVTKFSTCGLDGKVVVWNVEELKHLNPATALY